MTKRALDGGDEPRDPPLVPGKKRKGKRKSKAERLARTIGGGPALTSAASANADESVHASDVTLATLLADPRSSTSIEWDVAQSLALRIGTLEAKELVVSTILWTKEAPKAAAHYTKRLQLTEASILRILVDTERRKTSTIGGGGDDDDSSSSSSRDGVSNLLVAKFLVEVSATMISNEQRLETFLWPWLVAQANANEERSGDDATDPSNEDATKGAKASLSHAMQAHSAAIRLLLRSPSQQHGSKLTRPTKTKSCDDREGLQRLFVEKCIETGEFLHFVSTCAPAFRADVDHAIVRAVATLKEGHAYEQTDGWMSRITDAVVVETEQLRRQKVANRIEGILQMMWPDAKVMIFGSSATGLLQFNQEGASDDDLDLCVLLPSSPCFRQASAPLIVEMKEHMSLYLPDCKDLLAIEGARIPILHFTDPLTGLKCDLCVNNVAALWNTQLIRRALHACNPVWSHRIRSLSLWLKQWRYAKRLSIGSGISSYGVQLLVLYYFQQRRVLPAFRLKEPVIESSETLQSFDCDEVNKVLMAAEAKLDHEGQARGEFNDMTPWSVLIDFFKFYGMEFDYENTVISLRSPDVVSKTSKQWTRKAWKTAVSIEDPIEMDRDLGTLFNRKTLAKLRTLFVHACVVFSKKDLKVREQETKLLECAELASTPSRKDSVASGSSE
ncbi:S-m checkpoint control protein, partial [Globisporangium splendens]